MKPTFTHEADFRQQRDFGAKVTATFDFLSAQFKPFAKCLAYFVLPAALLMGIGVSLFMAKAVGFYSSLFKGIRNNTGTSGIDPLAMYRGTGGIGLAIMLLGLLVAFLLLSSAVYAYVRVRLTLDPAQTVQPRQVWAWMRPRLGRVLLAWLLLFGLFAGAMLLVGGVAGGLAVALGRSGWIFLPILALYVGLAWLAGCLALYFPVLWLEDVGVGAALRRTFYLIKGKWWSTFGLYVAVSFIQSTLSYLFALPLYGVLASKVLLASESESPVLMLAAGLLYAGGTMLLFALPLLAMSFQYFNLVERRDGVGARQLLQQLGRTPAPAAQNTTYRADEEGEY